MSFYLHDSWYNALGIGYNEVVTLENYYECIDDPAERERIMRSKEAFKKKPKGSFWQEQFTICGKRIHSFACMYANKMVVGGDSLVDNPFLNIAAQTKRLDQPK